MSKLLIYYRYIYFEYTETSFFYHLFLFSLLQLFGDMDVLPNYGIPMNPDLQPNTGGSDLDQNAAGSELISYQPNLSPIDFTDFLNIDEPTAPVNSNGEDNDLFSKKL